LAGFPKDTYYKYQSEWSKENVLHVFPHWNWNQGQSIDVCAYFNNASEVELYLNGKSLGKRSKVGNEHQVKWTVKYKPGTLKAVSRKFGQVVLTQEIKTAGKAERIRLTPDRKKIKADGNDLCFVTVELVDKDGNVLPTANKDLMFTIEGVGKIVGTDNGNENDSSSRKRPERRMNNGKCLVLVQSNGQEGVIKLKAIGARLPKAELEIKTK
jgi:beta-galactosidase